MSSAWVNAIGPFTNDPRDSELGRALIASADAYEARKARERDELAALIFDKSGLGEWSATQLADAILAAGWAKKSQGQTAQRDAADELTRHDQALGLYE